MSTNQNKININEYYMRLALSKAQRSIGNTAENPSVGCVIVKNNSVVGSGSTSKLGRPHAELNAINNAKGDIKNSKIYITLEPCSHYGKSPPCVKNIIRKKIKRVYFSINDPDKRSWKKSYNILKKKKIFVKSGILKSKIDFFYRSYKLNKLNDLPFVTAKIATSKDYYTVEKRKRWITNKFSRGRVHLLRSQHDCIITSSLTVIKDNPLLTCRIKGLGRRSPTRIVLDKKLKIPLGSNVIKTAKFYPTIIFYNSFKKRKIKELKKLNVKMINFSINNNNFDLKKILLKIKKLGFSRIFLESGVRLISNFLNEGLINDFHHFISPYKIGKRGKNNMMDYMILPSSKKIKKSYVNLFEDKLNIYKIK